jgi:hypothetical protein
MLQPDGSYSGNLHRTTAPGYDPARPPVVQVQGVGTMRVSFSDGENGSLTYTVNGRAVAKAITRMVFAGTVPACRY